MGQCKTPKDAVWLFDLLVREVHVSSARTRTRYEFDLSVIERFADLEVIRKLAEDIKESDLDEREKNAVRAFRHSLKCRDEGKPNLGLAQLPTDEEDDI